MRKNIIVFGAGGFIGGHLVKKLKELGHWVRGVDIKKHEFNNCNSDEFIEADLSNYDNVEKVLILNNDEKIDEIYQLAADMGGAQYVFTGENDANIMSNSAAININILKASVKLNIKKIFYSSSACVYNEYNQMDPNNPDCKESSAYPAHPDSEYGWEKLFSERLYLSYMKNYGIDVRIARYHNIFGPYGTWYGGKEKAPAAICRKIAEANDEDFIEIFGDGEQTRSFLYVDECINGTLKLMESDFTGPVNIGSEEMVTINQLVKYVSEIANKKIKINHITGPLGVRGRNSNNTLIKEKLNWEPKMKLKDGLKLTYDWINKELKFNKNNNIRKYKCPIYQII